MKSKDIQIGKEYAADVPWHLGSLRIARVIPLAIGRYRIRNDKAELYPHSAPVTVVVAQYHPGTSEWRLNTFLPQQILGTWKTVFGEYREQAINRQRFRAVERNRSDVANETARLEKELLNEFIKQVLGKENAASVSSSGYVTLSVDVLRSLVTAIARKAEPVEYPACPVAVAEQDDPETAAREEAERIDRNYRLHNLPSKKIS